MKLEIRKSERIELPPDELVAFLKTAIHNETQRDVLQVVVHPDLHFPNLFAMTATLGIETEYSRAKADLAKDDSRRFQNRVAPWMEATFGPEISGDKEERNHRFFEEATELVQAGGMTADEAHQLVDYTYGRPVGELRQEVGGVMVTLAALCLAQGVDMHEEGEVELERIWGKVEQIRAKQAAKPKFGPLPGLPIKERIQANRDAEAEESARQAACRRLMAASDTTVAMVEAVLDSASKGKIVERLSVAAGNSGLLGLTATPQGMQALRAGEAVTASVRAALETPILPSAIRGLNSVILWLNSEIKSQQWTPGDETRSSAEACKSLLNDLVATGHVLRAGDELVSAHHHVAVAHARMLFLLNTRQEKENSYTDLVRACETIARYPAGEWRQSLREAAYAANGSKLHSMASWVFGILINEGFKI